MGYNWMAELEKEAKKRVSEVVAEATQRAQYRVQRDFHTKTIDVIAKETGHVNLAQACFCMLNNKGSDINVEIYYDESFIEGFFRSNSSFHQDGGRWKVAKQNQNLSVYDFWDMHYNDETGGSYGEVEEDWIMENFWNGREYVTNGWPLSKSAEYLSGHYRETVSAYEVAQNFIDNYIAEGHYERYIQEEINNLI
jgi:hypothetical protein